MVGRSVGQLSAEASGCAVREAHYLGADDQTIWDYQQVTLLFVH